MARSIRTTIALLMVVAVLAGAGGCSPEAKERRRVKKEQKAEEKQRKEQAKQDKKAGDAAKKDGTSRDKFEASSDDPPFSADTRYAAGQLAESQNNLENAINQYREALRLNPNHRDAMFRLGWVYTQAKRYNEAIPLWQRYLKVTNNATQAYNNLALTYEAAGRIPEAEQTYKAAIERDPAEATCRNNYGRMLARQNRVDEAIAQLSIVQRPADVHYNLGTICEETGRVDEAKAYYRKALELDPKLRDARSRLAVLK